MIKLVGDLKYSYMTLILNVCIFHNTYKHTRDDALSLASWGNNSAINTNGNGPRPKAKDMENIVRLTCIRILLGLILNFKL